jgi:hypothetical protein
MMGGEAIKNNACTRLIRTEGDLAYVPLTNGFEAIIDAGDAELIGGFVWFARRQRGNIYAARSQRGVNGKVRQILMHRVIMNEPTNLQVDHINGDGLDNTRANLRLATPSQNCQNIGKRLNNSSGYKGVCRSSCGKKWRAQIRSPNKKDGSGGKVFLGHFATAEEAYAAYCKASKKLHGEYSKLA